MSEFPPSRRRKDFTLLSAAIVKFEYQVLIIINRWFSFHVVTGIPDWTEPHFLMALCVYGSCSSLCLICFSLHFHQPSSHSFLTHAYQPSFPPISLLQQRPSGGAFPDQPSNHAHPNAQADRSVPCALSYCPMNRCRCQPSHWFDYLPVGLPPPLDGKLLR